MNRIIQPLAADGRILEPKQTQMAAEPFMPTKELSPSILAAISSRAWSVRCFAKKLRSQKSKAHAPELSHRQAQLGRCLAQKMRPSYFGLQPFRLHTAGWAFALVGPLAASPVLSSGVAMGQNIHGILPGCIGDEAKPKQTGEIENRPARVYPLVRQKDLAAGTLAMSSITSFASLVACHQSKPSIVQAR